MISTIATILTLFSPGPLARRKVCEISAPKIFACCSDSTYGVHDAAVRLALRRVVEHPEQGQEDRRLEQQRQARGERVGARLLVQLHHFLTELLPVVAVLLLQLLHLRLQQLHVPAGPDLPHEERDQQGPDDDRQAGDRQRPGPAAVRIEHRRQQPVPARQQRRHRAVQRGHHRVEHVYDPVPQRESSGMARRFTQAPRCTGPGVDGRSGLVGGDRVSALVDICWWNGVVASGVPRVAAGESSSPPASYRAPRRGARPLPERKPNNWGRTGTPARTSG